MKLYILQINFVPANVKFPICFISLAYYTALQKILLEVTFKRFSASQAGIKEIGLWKRIPQIGNDIEHFVRMSLKHL